MNGLVLGTMMALSMVQAQTDTTFAVGGAEKLDVETMGGSIRILVWDEDRVRVQAEHSNRTYIEIEHGSREIRIESEARRGPANLVDFIITVPRRLSLELEAQYGDITIEGSDGEIQAETLQGDVSILGGRGVVEVEATIGNIYVDGADGLIEIESSAADIHVVNSSGEIYAETAGGTIVLENVSPTAVDVGSTGGRVHYDGSYEPGGTYFFGAHGGSITLVVGEEASASFNVATVHGSITSNLSGTAESLRGGERHEFQVGAGAAIVEAETYGGRIRLLRRGTEGTEAPVRRNSPVRDDDVAWRMWGPDDHLDLADDFDLEHDFDLENEFDHDFDFADDFHFDFDFGGMFEGHGVGAAVAPQVAAAAVPHVSLGLAEIVNQALSSTARVRTENPPATIRR
jgi:hypothetical protein